MAGTRRCNNGYKHAMARHTIGASHDSLGVAMVSMFSIRFKAIVRGARSRRNLEHFLVSELSACSSKKQNEFRELAISADSPTPLRE